MVKINRLIASIVMLTQLLTALMAPLNVWAAPEKNSPIKQSDSYFQLGGQMNDATELSMENSPPALPEIDRGGDPFRADRNAATKSKNNQASVFTKNETEPKTQQEAAGIWTQRLETTGGLLSSSHPQDVAKDYAVGKLNSAVSGNVQAWLSQFGTARVNLAVDRYGTLNESAIDLLLPFYDNKKSLLAFSQWGYRHKDKRNTNNIGLGTRFFHNDWMYGANTFFDNDVTGDNRRWGIGGEIWTDYLKLSANGYFRISNWHQSRDFNDYEERPANGYDLNASMYLPALPNLGANLKYEQYYGDNVALFGKDSRQKDPHAVTMGLSYTPIPLVTTGLEHRQGASGKNDTQITINLNVKLGAPLSAQLSPDNVAAMRSLAGSRYDLVDRNNNIVLDYRKMSSLRLFLPAEEKGFGGEVKNFPIRYESKNGVAKVEWSAPELEQNGGVISPVSGDMFSVTLPAYRDGGVANNTYLVTGIAVDRDGNRSEPAQMRVIVTPLMATKVLVTPPGPLKANGQQAYTFTATGLPPNQKVSSVNWAIVSGNVAGLTLTPGAETTDGNGQLTATLTSTEPVNDVQVALSLDHGNNVPADKSVSFEVDESTAMVAQVSVDQAGPLLANGQAAYTYTAIIKDRQGNLLRNQAITGVNWLSVPDTAQVPGLVLTPGAVTTDGNGQLTATLKSTALAKDVLVSLQLGSAAAVAADKKVSFNADSSTARVTQVVVDQAGPLPANGQAVYTYSATVTDSNGNVLRNQALTGVNWRSTPDQTPGLVLTPGTVTTDDNGKLTATLKSTAVVKDVLVSLQLGSTTVAADKKVSFDVDLSSARVTAVVVDKSGPLPADGQATYTYTATIVDGNDAPIREQEIPDLHWNKSSGLTDVVLTPGSSKTDSQGQLTATLTSRVGVDNVLVSLQLGTAPKVDADKPVSFTAVETPVGIYLYNASAPGVNTFFPKQEHPTNVFKTLRGQLKKDASTPIAENGDVVTYPEVPSMVTMGDDGVITFTNTGQGTIKAKVTKPSGAVYVYVYQLNVRRFFFMGSPENYFSPDNGNCEKLRLKSTPFTSDVELGSDNNRSLSSEFPNSRKWGILDEADGGKPANGVANFFILDGHAYLSYNAESDTVNSNLSQGYALCMSE